MRILVAGDSKWIVKLKIQLMESYMCPFICLVLNRYEFKDMCLLIEGTKILWFEVISTSVSLINQILEK